MKYRFFFLVLLLFGFLLISCGCETQKGLQPYFPSTDMSDEVSLAPVTESKPVESTQESKIEGVPLPCSDNACKNYTLGKLVHLFAQSGFFNIEVLPCEISVSENFEDRVLAVLIDGNSDFNAGDIYRKDARIHILYALCTPVDETEETKVETNDTVESAVPDNEAVVTETSASAEEVFVYVTESGSKYHSKANCSDMKNSQKISISKAESMNYTPCKRCY